MANIVPNIVGGNVLDRETIHKNNYTIKYNTLFGKVEVHETEEGNIDTVKLAGDATRDYIAREFGIFKRIFNIERSKNALLNPTRFFTEKQNDLVDINFRVAQRFKEIYADSIKRGMKNSEAESSALKGAKSVFDQDMAEHRDKFPKEISKTLYEKFK